MYKLSLNFSEPTSPNSYFAMILGARAAETAHDVDEAFGYEEEE